MIKPTGNREIDHEQAVALVDHTLPTGLAAQALGQLLGRFGTGRVNPAKHGPRELGFVFFLFG